MSKSESTKQEVFTVHAYRWGSWENHSYIVGVFTDEQEAIAKAIEEEQDRGGKYECEVRQWDLTQPTKRGRVVRELKDPRG